MSAVVVGTEYYAFLNIQPVFVRVLTLDKVNPVAMFVPFIKQKGHQEFLHNFASRGVSINLISNEQTFPITLISLSCDEHQL